MHVDLGVGGGSGESESDDEGANDVFHVKYAPKVVVRFLEFAGHLSCTKHKIKVEASLPF